MEILTSRPLGRAENTIECNIRSDDSGIWNTFKAWYLPLVHLAASSPLMVSIIGIDNHDFKIGSDSTLVAYDSGLYRAQVTPLISLGLVIIRSIAS